MEGIKGLLALRIGYNTTIKTFIKSKNSIDEMAKRMQK